MYYNSFLKKTIRQQIVIFNVEKKSMNKLFKKGNKKENNFAQNLFIISAYPVNSFCYVEVILNKQISVFYYTQ